jgi:hypothetical protein
MFLFAKGSNSSGENGLKRPMRAALVAPPGPMSWKPWPRCLS